jgi:hypothetical protein
MRSEKKSLDACCVASPPTGRRGSLNIQRSSATKILTCRVLNKGSGKPNLVIGDFVNYLLQRHRRRIRHVVVLPE